MSTGTTILQNILNILGIIFNSKVTYLIITFVFILLYLKSCKDEHDLKVQNTIQTQNIIAQNDTIKIIKQKNGEIESSIASYVATDKDLKNLNKNLYDLVKNESGQIVSLGNIVFRLQQDSSVLKKHADSLNYVLQNPVDIGHNQYAINWELKYNYDAKNYDALYGTTKVGLLNNSLSNLGTYLTNRETSIDLTFGEKVESGKLRVFAETKYPGFTTESLSGVLIDPNSDPYIKSLMKKKKLFPNTWSVGISITPGFNLGTGSYGLVIVPSIQYNIFTW